MLKTLVLSTQDYIARLNNQYSQNRIYSLFMSLMICVITCSWKSDKVTDYYSSILADVEDKKDTDSIVIKNYCTHMLSAIATTE